MLQLRKSVRALRAFLPALLILPTVATVLSFIMTWATVGFGPEFIASWLRGLATTLVVLPVMLASLGALEAFVDKVIGHLSWITRKLVVAGLTACVLEAVIGFAVTAVGHRFDDSFAGNWWLAFSRSLPAGLAISLFMGFYLKPKLDGLRAVSVQGAAGG